LIAGETYKTIVRLGRKKKKEKNPAAVKAEGTARPAGTLCSSGNTGIL